MRLIDYLTRNEMTRTAFAQKAGLTVPTVSRTASGRTYPSLTTLRAIVAATEGAVQPNDFFDGEEIT